MPRRYASKVLLPGAPLYVALTQFPFLELIPYTPVMSDDRQAVHELVDQAPEEVLPYLLGWLTELLHPSESSAAESLITFFPTEAETIDAAATSETENEPLPPLPAEADRGRVDQVDQDLARALARLGVRPESLGMPVGQSASGTREGFLELHCDWQAGPRRRHRLGTLYLEKQEIITLERVQVSEGRAQVEYRIRVLTRAGEEDGEFRIPLFREPRSQ